MKFVCAANFAFAEYSYLCRELTLRCAQAGLLVFLRFDNELHFLAFSHSFDFPLLIASSSVHVGFFAFIYICPSRLLLQRWREEKVY